MRPMADTLDSILHRPARLVKSRQICAQADRDDTLSRHVALKDYEQDQLGHGESSKDSQRIRCLSRVPISLRAAGEVASIKEVQHD